MRSRTSTTSRTSTPTSTSPKRSWRRSSLVPLTTDGMSGCSVRCMRARRPLLIVAVALIAGSCTSNASTTVPSTVGGSPPTWVDVSPPPTGATLADGSALPARCTGEPTPDETVAFVADGRGWVLDPATGRLACLFPVRQPGAFTFGPQGDRVLLGGLAVARADADAPTWPSIGPTPTVFDWGRPLGLAVVYASPGGAPEKRFMDDGSVEKLTSLPTGTYESIAYHPSGLALGFIVDEGRRQGIWLSSNEGKDAVRLVFSRPDTTFSSVAFSPDGTQIWWIAQHEGALSEVHWMDLADRSTFQTVLSRGLTSTARRLQLAPSGPLLSATQGASCEQEQAMVVDTQGAHPAIADGGGPTHALGWLDAKTLFVATGGCGQPESLSTVAWSHGVGTATAVVDAVDIGAPRTVLHNAPTEVPSPPDEAPPAPPGGVG